MAHKVDWSRALILFPSNVINNEIIIDTSYDHKTHLVLAIKNTHLNMTTPTIHMDNIKY